MAKIEISAFGVESKKRTLKELDNLRIAIEHGKPVVFAHVIHLSGESGKHQHLSAMASSNSTPETLVCSLVHIAKMIKELVEDMKD